MNDSPSELQPVFQMVAEEPSLKINLGCVTPIIMVILFFVNPVLSVVGGGFCAIYFYWDKQKWVKEGVRRIEVDQTGINVYRGPTAELNRIDREQITDVNVFTKRSLTTLNIMLGGTVSKAPGVTFFSGPRLRLQDDIFDSAQFRAFIEKVNALR